MRCPCRREGGADQEHGRLWLHDHPDTGHRCSLHSHLTGRPACQAPYAAAADCKCVCADIEPDLKVRAAMNEINAAQRLRCAHAAVVPQTWEAVRDLRWGLGILGPTCACHVTCGWPPGPRTLAASMPLALLRPSPACAVQGGSPGEGGGREGAGGQGGRGRLGGQVPAGPGYRPPAPGHCERPARERAQLRARRVRHHQQGRHRGGPCCSAQCLFCCLPLWCAVRVLCESLGAWADTTLACCR